MKWHKVTPRAPVRANKCVFDGHCCVAAAWHMRCVAVGLNTSGCEQSWKLAAAKVASKDSAEYSQ